MDSNDPALLVTEPVASVKSPETSSVDLLVEGADVLVLPST